MPVLYPDVIKLDLRLLERPRARRTSRGSSPPSARRPSAATRPCSPRASTPSEQLATARAVGRDARPGLPARRARAAARPAAGARAAAAPRRQRRRPVRRDAVAAGDELAPPVRGLAPAGRARRARCSSSSAAELGRDRDGARRARRRDARRARSTATRGCPSASRSSACSTPAARSTAAACAAARWPTTRWTGTLVALAPGLRAPASSRAATGDGRVGVRDHLRPRHGRRVRAAADGADGAADR